MAVAHREIAVRVIMKFSHKFVYPWCYFDTIKWPVVKCRGGGGGGGLSTGFQWPTPELFVKIGAAHPWSGTEKTSDPPPNQNQ